MANSVYIHIPFCKKICSYCDFCKVYYDKKFVIKYLDSLKREIESKYQNEKIKTIYIGGGTPSVLDIGELEYLFSIISIFDLDKDYEFTVECNFDSITFEKIDLFKKSGVNRISFGIETTDSLVLSKLNRDLDTNYVKKIINYAKEVGLDNINVDLMYGFSFSSFENLKRDLDFILNLDIKHISTYSLIISENTKFFIENIKSIDEEEDLKMYNYIHTILTEHGYNHYEISNFSKQGYESRHNLVYWNNLEYYGFGVSASSYLGDYRLTNTKSITKYINDFDNNIEKETLSIYDKMIYEMILGLRLSVGVNTTNFYQKYHRRVDEAFSIGDLIGQNLLCFKDDRLYVPFDKWYVINSILINFLEVNRNE